MNPYLKSKVLTARPEELRLMLYDGAIKFCRQAEHAIGQKDWEAMYNSLVRAQKIVLELSTSLNPETEPELCDRLNSLYNYIYRRLVDANLERDSSPVAECLRLLDYERETWAMAIRKERGDTEGESAPAAEPEPDHAPSNPIGSIGMPDASAGFSAEG